MIVSNFLRVKWFNRSYVTAIVAATFILLSWAEWGQAQTGRTGPSGLPLPRFVSLKSDRVNVRIGPSRDHNVGWTFVKEGLPVEIVQEFDNWRQIRDYDGEAGWIFHKLLSGRRTALVNPETEEKLISIYRSESNSSDLVAQLEPNVLVNVSKCSGEWCRVDVNKVTGWIAQSELYGVYPNEKF